MASDCRVSRRGPRRSNPRPPAQMNAAEIALVASTALGLVACAGWVRAHGKAARYWQLVRDDCATDEGVRDIARPVLGRMAVDGDSYGVPPLEEITRDLVARANRAESACEELRASLMRGSTLMRVKLHSAHHAADHELEIAVIDGTPHAFTDSVLPRARSVYERAVANKQIDPVI
jgi:hypothetical protein